MVEAGDARLRGVTRVGAYLYLNVWLSEIAAVLIIFDCERFVTIRDIVNFISIPGARDKLFCAAHGGGKRCSESGCNKSAVGGSMLCTGHGGGKRCRFEGEWSVFC